MRRSLSPFIALATAALLAAAGCGNGTPGDHAAASSPSTSPAATSPAATAASIKSRLVTPAQVANDHVQPADVQAKALILGGSAIPDWEKYLTTVWKQKPHEHWSAKRLTDVRWVGRLELSAPGHTLRAAWTINAPLGPHPTADQINASLKADTPPKPRDAGARLLATNPPVLPVAGTGPIELPVVVTHVDPAAGTLTVNASPEVSGTGTGAPRAIRRAILLRGTGQDRSNVTIHVDANTRFKATGDTDHKSLAAFAKAVTSLGPQPYRLIWRIKGAQPSTWDALVALPVSNVKLSAG